ncbi:peptidoglycan-binding protein [Roseomonas sp. HJA6]|uniref:Peptidoglycan-binding protein n=1 Tax=Roseomonas alba TaxID=2846776 RepID=A0ABS7A3Q7_9PROT|nr:peptidoglycan-binding protein [Neoroseomonas alba]MBW6396392.1 peptidoglycan-binding protein [Neoroseomonas alba]
MRGVIAVGCALASGFVAFHAVAQQPIALTRDQTPALILPLSPEEAGAIVAHVGRCWSTLVADGSPDDTAVQVRIDVNERGVVTSVRPAERSGGVPTDPRGRAVFESGRRAFLDPRCNPLPLPADRLAAVRQATFRLSPTRSAVPPAPPPSGPAVLGISGRQEVGPSFDCARATEPLAQIICGDLELRRLDLEMVQPLYVLRHLQVERASEFRQQAVQLHRTVITACGIPLQGAVDAADLPRLRSCITVNYRNQRASWLRQLRQADNSSATEEAERDISGHIALQRLLKDRGFLPQDAVVDGVYGPATRSAISRFQAAHNLRADGLMSQASALALNPPPAHVAGGQGAQSRGSAPHATADDYQNAQNSLNRRINEIERNISSQFSRNNQDQRMRNLQAFAGLFIAGRQDVFRRDVPNQTILFFDVGLILPQGKFMWTINPSQPCIVRFYMYRNTENPGFQELQREMGIVMGSSYYLEGALDFRDFDINNLDSEPISDVRVRVSFGNDQAFRYNNIVFVDRSGRVQSRIIDRYMRQIEIVSERLLLERLEAGFEWYKAQAGGGCPLRHVTPF